MPKTESWTWFWAELERLLGPDEVARLREELRRRRAREFEAQQKKTAPARIARWEKELERARREGRGTKRLEQQIERARRMLEGEGERTQRPLE